MRGRLLAGRAAALLASLTVASAPGHTVTVYRCGADGRTFSQTPCPAGDGRAVAVADERDASQRAEALDATRCTTAAADHMAGARERLEAARVRAPGIIPVTRSGEAGDRKAGKASKKRKGPPGDDRLTGPFKGVSPDEGDGKKPVAPR